MMKQYRLFKITKKATPQSLSVANSQKIIHLKPLGDYQQLKTITKMINETPNRKTLGLKFTRPIVHASKKYLIVKIN